MFGRNAYDITLVLIRLNSFNVQLKSLDGYAYEKKTWEEI